MVTVEISRNVPFAKDQNTFNLESVSQICLITLILLINTLVKIFLLHLLIHYFIQITDEDYFIDNKVFVSVSVQHH